VKNEKDPDLKRPYEIPKLRTIPLVAEEVLAVKCKQTAGAPSGKLGLGCGNISCMSTGGS